MQVSAKDLGTGKHQEITITASSNLSDSEIEQAIREAQEYEATDGQDVYKRQHQGTWWCDCK